MRGIEDYLGQIKRLEEDGQRCTATHLAQSLGVSLPSTSEMIKRLSKDGYLQRQKDGALQLTQVGRAEAHKILRRHRLVERLLTDVLGMPWHEVHGEAHRMEHAISARVEAHLAQSLGFPEYCPHGHPICPVDRRTLRPLDETASGDEVSVAQISEVNDELLAFLDQLGLRPASILKIIDDGGGDKPFTMATDAGTVSVAREVAAYVQVSSPEESGWLTRKSI
ncbi:MAG: metal-dependent transcriptional regulator [Actinomycetota bacterium]|nr:metal-dependent transcriptional regulator [Actinomycetota bacterium]